MGDPRRIKKKFSGPRHPWKSDKLEEERKLLDDYSLKTKTELWKVSSTLKNYAGQAKRLIAAKGVQSDVEKAQLFQRLQRLGLVGENPQLDNVLDLKVTSLLDRRLQTLVFKRGFARTMKQSRQFITHRHILVAGKQIVTPSYIVPVKDESLISFVSTSTIANPEHPERVVIPVNHKKIARRARAKSEDDKYKSSGNRRQTRKPESGTRNPSSGGAS